MKLFTLLLNNCKECPYIDNQMNLMVCTINHEIICKNTDFLNFINKNKFAKFCKLRDIEEIIIEENGENENKNIENDCKELQRV